MRDDILIETRMLSNPVPLVNIANMCQNVCQILAISNISVCNNTKRKQLDLCL